MRPAGVTRDLALHGDQFIIREWNYLTMSPRRRPDRRPDFPKTPLPGDETSPDKDRHRELDQHHPMDHPHPRPKHQHQKKS